MKKQLQHQTVYSELLADILAGKHKEDRRLPSESQLVVRFGVSRPTVARALRDLESQGLVERRAGSGTYIREDSEVKPAKQLGLMVPGLGDVEIFDVICGELASLARVHDLGMHWGVGARVLPGAHEFSGGRRALRFLHRKRNQWGILRPISNIRVTVRRPTAASPNGS